MSKGSYRLFKKNFFEKSESKNIKVFNTKNNPLEIGWISATKDFMLSFLKVLNIYNFKE